MQQYDNTLLYAYCGHTIFKLYLRSSLYKRHKSILYLPKLKFRYESSTSFPQMSQHIRQILECCPCAKKCNFKFMNERAKISFYAKMYWFFIGLIELYRL